MRVAVFRTLVGLLVAFVVVASLAAIKVGSDEARLAHSGPRQALRAEELVATSHGWVAVAGCMRHNLAVGVDTRHRVYRLGREKPTSTDDNLAFTPLVAATECNEGVAPTHIYALVEDEDSLVSTLGHVWESAWVPPPAVVAIIDGVIGYGRGHGYLARAARADLATRSSIPVDELLLVKGSRPGSLTVGLFTAGCGIHGLLLLGLVVWWRRRRANPEATFFASPATASDDHDHL